MSSLIFPVVRGVSWTLRRTPIFNTINQKCASLKSVRGRLAQYPIWKFAFTWNYLKRNPNDMPDPALTPYNDFETLAGWVCARAGQFDNFLIRLSDFTQDQSDSTAQGQLIGTGNGSNKIFQLVVNLGSFVDWVQAPAASPVMYLNGAPTTAFTLDQNTGLVTFTSAPGNGVIVSADFSFYHRVTLDADAYDFDALMYQLWNLKQITFVTDKI